MDSPVTESDSNVPITLPNTSQGGKTSTSVVAATAATSSEASDNIRSTTSIYAKNSESAGGQISTTPTTLMIFTNDVTTSLRISTSTSVPDLMTLSPISIIQSLSTDSETLPPFSTIRAASVSSSIELLSPGQPIIGTHNIIWTTVINIYTGGMIFCLPVYTLPQCHLVLSTPIHWL